MITENWFWFAKIRLLKRARFALASCLSYGEITRRTPSIHISPLFVLPLTTTLPNTPIARKWDCVVTT